MTDEEKSVNQRDIMRLGGFAGIGVGLFVLSFAISGDSIGGLFAPEVLWGGSGNDWLQRVVANPGVARIAIALPVIGFSLMLVVALSLFRLIDHRNWAATLGLAGFLVGVPLAVMTFVSATALVFGITHGAAVGGDVLDAELRRYMLVNFAAGPFFMVVVGNSCMSLAAWRTGVLPSWLCCWGIINAIVMIFGILSVCWPAFGIGQLGGPLTMLWFVTTGVVLLVRSRRTDVPE